MSQSSTVFSPRGGDGANKSECDKLTFMVTSVVQNTINSQSGDKLKGYEPISMRIFGRKKDGSAVSVRVEGVCIFFYVICDFEHAHEVVMYVQNCNNDRSRMLDIDGGVKKMDDKRDLYEYSGATGNVFKLSFVTRSAFYNTRRAIESDRSKRLTMYEHKGVNTDLRFMVDTCIVPMGWVSAPNAKRVSAAETKCSGGDFVLEDGGASLQSLSGDLGQPPLNAEIANTVAPLRFIWFDIECVSDDKSFPKAETAQVIMIGVLSAEGDRVHRHCIFHLRDIARIDGDPEDRFVQCNSEVDLILRFADFVAEFDADFVGGYNSGGFDFPFLFNRAEVIDCEEEFSMKLSRTHFLNAKLESMHFESGAHGSRSSFTVDMHGRGSYDLLEIIRREYKGVLSTYTLNAVSEYFLKDHKADVHHSMIPVLFERSAEDRRRLAQYCLKDVLLPFQIDLKLHLQMRFIEMARVCGVDLSTLLERGQQIKIVSQLLRACRDKGYILPLGSSPTGYEPSDYEGGAVLEPETGFYDIDRPVMVADFSSLYPSLMIAHNFCYTTYIPKESVSEFDEKDVFKSAAGHHFLRREKKQSLLSKLLESLLSQRKIAKKDMKAAAAQGDEQRESVMNSRQLALKVSANSIYGFTGVPLRSGGKLPLFEASESTTAEGRKALRASANYTKEHYDDATVVYGDSVAPQQTIMFRANGKHIFVSQARFCDREICRFNESHFHAAAPHWKPWGNVYGKEELDLSSFFIETFTDSGWVRVKRVIRHALEFGRSMRLVVTPYGFVRCTEDHSLVLADNKPALPVDVEVGQKLLTCADKMHLDWINSSGKKKASEEEKNECKALAHYLLTSEHPALRYFYLRFQCRNGFSGRRQLPNAFYYKPLAALQAFWEYIVDLNEGSEDYAFTWLSTLRDGEPELFHGIWYIACVILSRPYAFDENAQLRRRGKVNGSACVANSVYYVHQQNGGRSNMYVYDLQTDDSHFSTFGLVVHNTDSIFVRRDSIKTMSDAWEFLNKLGPEITAALFSQTSPMKLEPEKVVTPFLSIAKKRYAGLIYESPQSQGEMFFKGMEVVRRDNCPLVTKTLLGVCEFLFKKSDIESALELVRKVVSDLYMSRVPLSELIITRSLSREPSEYANKQPHAELVKRMRIEDEGSAPRVGDRVMHVMVERGAQKVFDMAEDPIKVIENTIPVNRTYYLQNQLRGPIERLMTPVVGSEKVNELFAGQHTRKRVVKVNMQKGKIGSFFAVKKKCSVCKVADMGSEGGICGDCKKRKSEQIENQQDVAQVNYEEATKQYEDVVKSCQQCLGIDGEVLCMQRDCAQLYDRLEKRNRVVKLGKDIEDLIL